MGSVVFLYLSALHIISTVDGDSSVKVTQIPDHVAAIRGTNVTFRCIFPFSQDGSEVEVQWNKKGESGYLDTKEDNRKLFGVKTKGSSFFQFLNVISQDSGVYRCVVVRQGSIIGTGSGSRLTVCDSKNVIRYLLWAGCAAGGFAFLALVIIIGKRCQLKKKNGSKGNLTQLGKLEDQAGEAAAGDNVAYVTLDLRSSNKTPRNKHQEDRTVYAQTKRGAAANKLTYAALDLPRSKNTGKAKHSDKNSEYSEVKIRNYEDGTFMESGTA
ncbi:uncharacterized protein LOC103185896 [Callorhinchus milii]|uniref:uncharacterized protein LOC103185896 n=1 Tax=Callorhinchus milii TaxID=7868 RepID=UPI001C3FD761|nr:uncharacterized protein LOC103185896 [Callorhinchus milii]